MLFAWSLNSRNENVVENEIKYTEHKILYRNIVTCKYHLRSHRIACHTQLELYEWNECTNEHWTELSWLVSVGSFAIAHYRWLQVFRWTDSMCLNLCIDSHRHRHTHTQTHARAHNSRLHTKDFETILRWPSIVNTLYLNNKINK